VRTAFTCIDHPMASKMPERRYFAQGKQGVVQEVRLFCGGVPVEELSSGTQPPTVSLCTHRNNMPECDMDRREDVM
jgi:hypothetical protein